MIYTFTYTDCSGNSHVWNYTYTIDIPDFVLPADGSSTVSCPADATAPTPPSVTDACGNVITPVAGPAPSPTACEGAMIYTFTYTIVLVIVTFGTTRTRSIYRTLLYLLTDLLP
jgi:hypothetical protein